MTPPVAFGHQGGWDEILLVLTPMALFAALLYVANRRASRLQHEREADRLAADEVPPDDDQPH